MEYVTILASLLATSNDIMFLVVLSLDQLYRLHLIGRFICGLWNHTPEHNRISRLLGESVRDKLPPVSMMPEARLVPWLQLEERY